jgi:hypothetical protein
MRAFINTDYSKKNIDDSFADGQYYVVSDFNSSEIQFQGDVYNPFKVAKTPASKSFRKGELVDVVTFVKDSAMNVAKAIKTDSGMFYADQNKLSKLKLIEPVEPVVSQLVAEDRKSNNNKTKIIIIGAFVLGFLLFKSKK